MTYPSNSPPDESRARGSLMPDSTNRASAANRGPSSRLTANLATGHRECSHDDRSRAGSSCSATSRSRDRRRDVSAGSKSGSMAPPESKPMKAQAILRLMGRRINARLRNSRESINHSPPVRRAATLPCSINCSTLRGDMPWEIANSVTPRSMTEVYGCTNICVHGALGASSAPRLCHRSRRARSGIAFGVMGLAQR